MARKYVRTEMKEMINEITIRITEAWERELNKHMNANDTEGIRHVMRTIKSMGVGIDEWLAESVEYKPKKAGSVSKPQTKEDPNDSEKEAKKKDTTQDTSKSKGVGDKPEKIAKKPQTTPTKKATSVIEVSEDKTSQTKKRKRDSEHQTEEEEPPRKVNKVADSTPVSPTPSEQEKTDSIPKRTIETRGSLRDLAIVALDCQ